VRYPDPSGSRVALIGWSGYARDDLVDLPCVAHNLTAFTSTIADQRLRALPPDRVLVLADQSRPHSTGIELTAAAEQAVDLLLVYAAGHLELSPQGEPQFPMTAPDDGGRPAALALTWLAVAVARSRATQRILILDAHLLGGPTEVAGIAHLVAATCAQVPGVHSWLYVTGEDDLYRQPGDVGTSFTAAFLEVAYRGPQRDAALDLVRLHEYTTQVLRRDLMPPPRLYLNGAPDPVMLFGYEPVGLSAVDVTLLHSTRHAAIEAERNYYRPDEAAEAFRRLVVVSQRVLGPDHEDPLRARHRLGHWTGHAGDARGAVRIFARLLDDQRRVLGDQNTETVNTHNDILYWSQR
jgi:hypothetical protein